MSAEIRRAAVLGAGAMGSRIAAHLANAGIDCLLLDLPAPGDTPQARNALVAKSAKGLDRSRPPAFFTPGAKKHLRIGNFEDDLERLADAEWIIEAVVEKFDVKRELLKRIDQVRMPGSLVSSNTSGLPIGKLAEGLSEDFRRHWLGTHFFNPPRYMRLLEIIPTPETLPEATVFLSDFCDRRLGKTVVRAHDRPNFIANRIFLFSFMHTLRAMDEFDLSIEEVDALTGPLLGRPRMATFRLADFAGIDVCLFVAKNLYELAPEDEKRELYRPPDFLEQMVAKGIVGDKARAGFYRRDRKAPGGRLVLDLETLQYRERKEPHWDSVAEVRSLARPADRITALIDSPDAPGRFLWQTLSELFLYAANRVPEVCNDIVSVDTVQKTGFNWQTGVFELWNELGVSRIAERIRSEGRPLPPLVERVLESPAQSFYSESGGTLSYFDLTAGTVQEIPERPSVLALNRIRAASEPIYTNPSTSLWDIGEGVALLEFRSKANTLDDYVFEAIDRSLDRVERGFDALVIGNEAENFSVGANLQLVLGYCLSGKWDELDQTIRGVQELVLRITASPKPVVAAVHGQTLAGGCEIMLRCDQVQAAAESYIGLVEVGVGLVPAAGGCCEMLRRSLNGIGPKDDLIDPTLKLFQMIGSAKVAGSAAEAMEWRYLRPGDGITMNRDRLLAEARNTAVGLAARGYEPTQCKDVLVGGRAAQAALDLAVWTFRQGRYISDYDVHVGKKLAGVLSGGDLTEPAHVSEDYLLGLEREAFLSLCGESRTQQRLEHLLKTGKPLRN